MTMPRFLLILLARKRVIVATVCMTLALTLLVSAALPDSYQARAVMLLDSRAVQGPAGVATQVELMRSRHVAARVVDQLGLAHSASAAAAGGNSRDRLAGLLLGRLAVVPARASNVVEIAFTAGEPQIAATIANAFAQQYRELVSALRAEAASKAAAAFEAQAALLRAPIAAARTRLSAYQQQVGIDSLDQRVELDMARLDALAAQLMAAQRKATEADEAAGQQGGARAAAPSGPVLAYLKVRLPGAEARLASVGGRLGRKHPQYRSAHAEADRIGALLDRQLHSASASAHVRSLEQYAASLRAALAAQQLRVIELQRMRDQLDVLARDLAQAQRDFEAASRRFMLGSSERLAAPFQTVLLSAATAPARPLGPNLLFNAALALLLGALLGLGLALLADRLDRRVRLAGDLADLLRAPVFGTIGCKAARRPRRD